MEFTEDCEKPHCYSKKRKTDIESNRLKASNEVFNNQLNEVIVEGENVKFIKLSNKQTSINALVPVNTNTIKTPVLNLESKNYSNGLLIDNSSGVMLVNENNPNMPVSLDNSDNMLKFLSESMALSTSLRPMNTLFNITKDYTIVMKMKYLYNEDSVIYNDNFSLMFFNGNDDVFKFHMYSGEKPGSIVIKYMNKYQFEVSKDTLHTLIIRLSSVESMLPYLTVFCDGKEILKTKVTETDLQHGLCGELVLNGKLNNTNNIVYPPVELKHSWKLSNLMIYDKPLTDYECVEVTKLLNPAWLRAELFPLRNKMKVLELDETSFFDSTANVLHNNVDIIEYGLNLTTTDEDPITLIPNTGIVLTDNTHLTSDIFVSPLLLLSPLSLAIDVGLSENALDSSSVLCLKNTLNNSELSLDWDGSNLSCKITENSTTFTRVLTNSIVKSIVTPVSTSISKMGVLGMRVWIVLNEVDGCKIYVNNVLRLQTKLSNNLFNKLSLNWNGTDSTMGHALIVQKLALYNRQLTLDEFVA